MNDENKLVGDTVEPLVLPDWDDCKDKYLNGTANPLEVFIHNNEPADEAARFRLELREAIEHVLVIRQNAELSFQKGAKRDE